MPALATDNVQGDNTAQLQLLLLHYLSSVLNKTETTTFENIDDQNRKHMLTISFDKDLFASNEIQQQLQLIQQDVNNKILQYQNAVLEQIRNSSHKSDDLFNDLQKKLDKFTENTVEVKNSLTEQNAKLSDRNKELQSMVSNLTNINDQLQNKISSLTNDAQGLQDKILKLTNENHDKDMKIQELEGDSKNITHKNQELQQNLNSVSATYTKIKDALGITDDKQNYCKLLPQSALWELSRKPAQERQGGFIWKPTAAEIAAKIMRVRYSSSRDKYLRMVDGTEINGWNKGTYSVNSFFRMVEQDFKVSYLARTVGTAEGSISWKFDVTGSGYFINNVRILFRTALFENGKVEGTVCAEKACINLITPDPVLDTNFFQGLSQFEIFAKTSLGKGWLHAQLFRLLLSDVTTYPFDVTITLQKCDIMAL